MKIELNLTRTMIALLVLGLVLAVLADVVLIATDHQKTPFPGSSIVGFWAILGFGGLVVITVVAKLLSRLLVDRPEDYYHETPEIDGLDGNGEGHHV